MGRIKGSKNIDKQPEGCKLSEPDKLRVVADLLYELVVSEFNTRRRKKRCKTV